MPIKLGKQTFTVPPPKVLESFGLQQRIVPVALRIIAAVTAVGGKLDLDAEVETLATPLAKVFSEMPPDELRQLTYLLLRKAKFDGHPLFDENNIDGEHAFDGLMAGRIMDVWKLLWHAFKDVWYRDFLSLAATFIAKDVAKASGSETSTTSETPGPATA